ncbi:MAG: RraA family protein [Kiloniellaceae bacterium]
MLTIRRGFERPAGELVAALAGVPTGHLVDAMGGRGAIDYRIKALVDGPDVASAFCGVALTCYAGPDDNLAVFAALEVARPGDVIVAATDAFDGSAVIGDLLLGIAKNRGVAAFVMDGLARDLEGIAAVGIPVFCRGVSPNSPARNGPGTVGLPVTLGGLTVASGDLIAGDRDGVVVVPRERAQVVIQALAAVRKAETALETKVRDGLEVPDFIRDLLASGRVRYLD